MTTETLPQTVPLEPTTPIRPSEAIRLGCILRPRQIRGHRFEGTDGACATGALLIGGGLGEESTVGLHWDRWPELMENAQHPESCISWKSTGRKFITGYLVEHLNDSDHGWSRERIADWLEGLGL